MLDFEIQKFKKVLQMKRYNVVRKLREEFPYLIFEDDKTDENGSLTVLVVKPKEPYDKEYDYHLLLKADFGDVLRAISNISMYENPNRWIDEKGVMDMRARKAKEEVTILFSSLFKCEPGEIDGLDGLLKVFEMCTQEVTNRLGNSYYTFFTTYDRKLDGPGLNFKDRLVSAMCRNHLDYTSRTGKDELLMFKRHEQQLVNHMVGSRIREMCL